MRIGVQTFTVRKTQKKDLESAYIKLVGLGIKDLEVARIDFTPENAGRIAKLSASHGIAPISIQVKPKYVFKSPESVMEFCRITGCKNVVISMLPFGCILGKEDKFYSFVQSLDNLYELYEKEGITLAYHHHNWEYVRLSSGRTRMQELLLQTRKIKFVCDTYWTARCGISPADQIRSFGNRLLGIHLRDLAFKSKFLSVHPYNTAVGTGVVDFSAVLSAACEVGAEYAVIEQKTDTPYEDIATGYSHIRKIISENKEEIL